MPPPRSACSEAGYVLLRLPLEVRDLFREWLMANFPDRYRHVFKLIRETRGGKDYDSSWGKRMTGGGPIAWMIGRRFELACEKLGFNKVRTKLTTEHFDPPRRGAAAAELVLGGRRRASGTNSQTDSGSHTRFFPRPSHAGTGDC